MTRRPTPAADADVPLPPHGELPARMPAEQRIACRGCGTPTLRATLAQYGMRCFRCFEAYLAEALPRMPDVGDKRADGPKAWAHALRRREERGEPLSIAQRDMWRQALRHLPAPVDEVEEVLP